MIKVLEKQWISDKGEILMQFLSSSNVPEDEQIYRCAQTPKQIIPWQYFDCMKSSQQMLLEFRESKHPLDWVSLQPKLLIYEKEIQTERNGCSNCISNASLQCSYCDQFHCCKNCACENFLFSKSIKCLNCNQVQALSLKCNNCNTELGDSMCDQCGVWFAPDQHTQHHCRKCSSCHDNKHQFCFKCKKCFQRHLFLELHCHKDSAVVCTICKQAVVTDSMKYQKHPCGCNICFLCSCKNIGQQCVHSNKIDVQEYKKIFE